MIFRNKLALFRMRRKDMPEYSRYDFFMTLDYSYSISSDILEERITGHTGGVALENIFGFLSLFAGAVQDRKSFSTDDAPNPD